MSTNFVKIAEGIPPCGPLYSEFW